MKFSVERKKWVIVTETYRDYEINVATNHRGTDVDILVFDTRKAVGDQDVTQEFECFQRGQIYGSMENIRAIMNEIDEREDVKEDEAGVKVTVKPSIPPGSNPMNYDNVQMGAQTGNWMILHMGEKHHTADIYHLPTGTRVTIDCSKLREYFLCIKGEDVEYGVGDITLRSEVWVCAECAPVTKNAAVLNWRTEDVNGNDSHYKLDRIEPIGRGFGSCDICGK